MRSSKISRRTTETEIVAVLNIDGSGKYDVQTPIGFLTHMLESFAKHGLFDLNMKADGDIHVDQHHIMEDCGLALGQAFMEALGDKKGISRSGYFVYPMDDALAVVAVDIGGRAYLQYDAKFKRQFCGGLDTDQIENFFQGFSTALNCNVAVRMPFGKDDHHKIEAIFKAFGKAMKMACSKDMRALNSVPSTKGKI